MLYIIPLTELSQFTGQTIEALKEHTYSHLEQMAADMKSQKRKKEQDKNGADSEYARLVKKYFEPYNYLRTWFSEEEIIWACALHMNERDLVSEQPIRSSNTGAIHYYEKREDAELIRESFEYMPKYYKNMELAEREHVKCHVYRVKNQYQGTRHGKVILELLYKRYPELKTFNFAAYEYHSYEIDYEIYPKNQVYTPFAALMAGDIETIKKRNLSYGSSYNAGEFTKAKVNERLESEEVKNYFAVIQGLKH